jgi:hypothetical protein
MKRRQNNWYIVSEEQAKRMAARGFATKQDANGKWRVLCHPRYLVEKDKTSNMYIDIPRD